MTKEERRRERYVSLVRGYLSERTIYNDCQNRIELENMELLGFNDAVDYYNKTGKISKFWFDKMAELYRKRLEDSISFWTEEGNSAMERNEKYHINELVDDYGVDLDELDKNIPYKRDIFNEIPESIIMTEYKG
jgi:hypothetical protein